MLVITNRPQDELNPRTSTNHPERRHFLILEKILKNKNENISVVFPEEKNTEEKIIKILNQVHHPLLIDFLKNVYNSARDNSDETYYHGNGIMPYNLSRSTVTESVLERCKHIDQVWKQIGLFCDDALTPIYENTWDTTLSSVLNCIHAVELNTDQSTPDLTYCLNICPGHHAGYLRYGGYCFVNNAMVTAFLLANQGNGIKVGILDIDYHAGNGTADILDHHQNNPGPTNDHPFNNICCVSIHCNPVHDYPFYEGYRDDYKNENILNIPFEKNTKISQYMDHLTEAIMFLKNHNIDSLVVAFGGDTYKDDPDVSLHSRCGLDIEDYFTIGKYIKTSFAGELKIIITQEGGYNLEHIAEIAESFLNGLRSQGLQFKNVEL